MTTKEILSTIMAMIADPAYDDPKSERCGRLADDVEPIIGAMLDQLVTHDAIETDNIIREVTARQSTQYEGKVHRNDVILAREVMRLRAENIRICSELDKAIDAEYAAVDKVHRLLGITPTPKTMIQCPEIPEDAAIEKEPKMPNDETKQRSITSLVMSEIRHPYGTPAANWNAAVTACAEHAAEADRRIASLKDEVTRMRKVVESHKVVTRKANKKAQRKTNLASDRFARIATLEAECDEYRLAAASFEESYINVRDNRLPELKDRIATLEREKAELAAWITEGIEQDLVPQIGDEPLFHVPIQYKRTAAMLVNAGVWLLGGAELGLYRPVEGK